MTTLLGYRGPAGDRNARGIRGADLLGTALVHRAGLPRREEGRPVALVDGGWSAQLDAARPALAALGATVGGILDAGDRLLLTMGRCAAALATLPQVARRHPDAAIVWFDAHGDCNVPDGRPADSYLGGMVLTGVAGVWETGLGTDVDLAQVVLAGSHDLDPPERERIARGEIALVAPGPDLGSRLRAALRGRAVYVHLDADVLDAGLAPTEYQVPGGLSYADLAEAFAVLAEHDVVGLEIAEFEGAWPDGREDDGIRLLEAVDPVVRRLTA